MKINGFTKYELDGSFIYLIFAKDLLYIGETQKITFNRWVQHFYRTGTFTRKIEKFGDPSIDYFKDIHLLSIELDKIRGDFPEVRWRTITQAVEHSLHVYLYKSQSDLLNSYYQSYRPEVKRFRIISDTLRTAPSRLSTESWEYAESYAEEVISGLKKYF